MKKSIFNFAIIAIITLGAIGNMAAQKFAHINTQQLLSELSSVKEADSKVKTYQETIMKKGQDMVKAFEAKYLAYADQAQSGELNKIQMQQKEAELTKEQQAIQDYEVEVQNLLAQKRETLYKPILEQVKKTIEALGKEDGYTMIFDTGSGALVHANESEDILIKVRSKLAL